MRNKKKNGVAAFWTRQVFSMTGFLFIIFFTIRGILQGVIACVTGDGEIGSAFSQGNVTEGILFAANRLKHPYIPALDTLLLICAILVIVHGLIGGYYAIMTDYKPGKMFIEKRGFYRQIFSTIGAGCILSAVMSPVGEAKEHTLVFWIITIVIAVIGSFHLANGFYNAGITLGISVSERTKFIFKILAWIIGVVSTIQVLVFFI